MSGSLGMIGFSQIKSPSNDCIVGHKRFRLSLKVFYYINQIPPFRFYSHNSSFIHGGIDGGSASGDPVRGQHEIHQKIMQLNFRDCHAKIRQVDAHATLGNGVVVQVRRRISCLDGDFIISTLGFQIL